MQIEERFWSKVRKTKGCWEWTGHVRPDGYATFNGPGGKTTYVHVFAYELEAGPIPKGLTLDHLCRTRRCVRRDHLEAVTNRVNVLRGNGIAAQNARKTHCSQGHPYDSKNTYVDRLGKRYCRTCVNRRMLERYHRLKAILAI